MDKNQLFILETKDKHWALKEKKVGSISNALTINNADKCSDTKHFKATYIADNKIINNAKMRKYLISKDLNKVKSEEDIFQIMQRHAPFTNPLTKGTDYSPCMHAGANCNFQTTSSMVVVYGKTETIWITGRSLPCLSIYKPYIFGHTPQEPIYHKDNQSVNSYWLTQEKINRVLRKKQLPPEFYLEKNQIQKIIINQSKEKLAKFDMKKYLEIEGTFYNKWINKKIKAAKIDSNNSKYFDLITSKFL